MIGIFKKFSRLQIIWTLLILFVTIVRMILGSMVGNWLPIAMNYDDALLIEYSVLGEHYSNLHFINDLLKNMGFPYLVWFFHLFKIPYSIWIAILWSLSGLCIIKLIFLLSNSNRKYCYSIFFYTFILFYPAAFDVWVGTRVYRNAVLAPLYLSAFSLSIVSIFQILKNYPLRKIILNQFLFSIFFILSYFVKEDGVWLLLSFLCLIPICYLVYFIKNRFSVRNCLISSSVIFIPFLLFFSSLSLYKYANYHYFGLYSTTFRCDSEYSKFINLLYKIDTPNNNPAIWASTDAIKSAILHSRTLSENHRLIEEIFRSPWRGGDLEANPVYGDFWGWILKDAVLLSQKFDNYSDVENFFGKVNSELQDEIEKENLKVTNKIQLISSMNARSYDEVLGLVPGTVEQFKIQLFFNEYVPGAVVVGDSLYEHTDFFEDLVKKSLKMLNTKNIQILMNQTDLMDVPTKNPLNNLLLFDFELYKIINTIVITFIILFPLFYIVKSICYSTSFLEFCLFSTYLGVICLCIVYAFSISWFCNFLGIKLWLKFYSSGIVSLYVIVSSISVVYVFDTLFFILKKVNIRVIHSESTQGPEKINRECMN